MKKLILFLAFPCIMLTSCDVVVFQNPVPEDAEPLESIPERFRGTYTFPGGDSNFDKLVIAEDHIESTKGMWFISDSMQVKKLGRNLVFNFQIRNQPSIKNQWLAVIVSPPRDGRLKTYQISSGLSQGNIDEGIEPKIVTEYGAVIEPIKKPEMTVYTMRADSDILKALMRDTSIAVMLVGKKMEEMIVIPSSGM